jgi:hypothetical protein
LYRYTPGAQLAMGTEHLTAPTKDPRAACPVALYYLYNAATTAYERSSKPGGQARVERLRLYEGVASERGDHKGESDDRMLYLRQAAELGGACFQPLAPGFNLWSLKCDFLVSKTLLSKCNLYCYSSVTGTRCWRWRTATTGVTSACLATSTARWTTTSGGAVQVESVDP